MEQCDTLIVAGYCLTVDSDDAGYEDHAVVITDGCIVNVLPAADARARYRPGTLIERPGHVVFPGLVNAHTHAAMTLFRGFGDDLPLVRWLTECIWPTEQRIVSAEMVRDGTRHALAEMLASGTTCFSDQYFFPDVVAQEADTARMRAVVAAPVFEAQTAWAQDAADCLQKAADLHDRYADHPRVSVAFAPHSTSVVTDDTFSALRIMCDQLDSHVQLHLHESSTELAAEQRNTGMRPVERLRRLGMINANLLAIHAVHLNDTEQALFAENGVSVVHCPRSNLKLASGIANVAAYRAAGITVGLGTDGAASNNELDMLGEMRSAALLAKAVAGDAATIPAASALRMATLDGAQVLGLADQIGSLEPGKSADIACVDLSGLNSQPVYDPASQLVYTAHPQQVSDVWVAGRHLLDNGELRYLDAAEITSRSGEWRTRIAGGQRTAPGQLRDS